jgi:hypothetical protein
MEATRFAVRTRAVNFRAVVGDIVATDDQNPGARVTHAGVTPLADAQT